MCNWFQNKSPTHTFAVDWETWHCNWAAPCYFNGASPTGSSRWGYCLQRHLVCEGLYGLQQNIFTLLIQQSSCCAPVPTSVAITAHVQKHMLLGLCTNTGLFLGNPTNKPYWSANPKITTYQVLLLCGDIQPNPGPRRCRGSQATIRQSQAIPLHSLYPSGYCQDHVGWETPGICRGNCDIWFHADRVDIDTQEYSLHGHESQTWNCYRCNTNNDSQIYQSYPSESIPICFPWLSPKSLKFMEKKTKILNMPIKFWTVIILNIPFLKMIIVCKLSPHLHDLCL